jgi:hypothetical protein
MTEKALLIISLLFGAQGYSVFNQKLPEYAQCSGSSYYGSRECMNGFECYERDEYYSQCLRSCPMGWKCNYNYFNQKPYQFQAQNWLQNDWQSYYQQQDFMRCDSDMSRSTCPYGYRCYQKDMYSSYCNRYCPQDWYCSRDEYFNFNNYQLSNINQFLPEYARCSNYDTCSNGLQCYNRDSSYGQCLKSCPHDWQCTQLSSSLNSFSSNCNFKFGQTWSNLNKDYSQMDYITIWASNLPTQYYNDMLRVCMEQRKTPVFYAYFIGSLAKEQWNLQDCRSNGSPNLCQKGAEFIRTKRTEILHRYRMFANETARLMGQSSESIWLIEPDFWQYHGENQQQNGALNGQYMRELYDMISQAIRCELPNARLAWNIPTELDEQSFSNWWNFFKTSQYVDFVYSNDGQTRVSSDFARGGNSLRWEFIYNLTKKRIIVDTVDLNEWNNLNFINERINDGFYAVTQLNSRSEWNAIARNMRPFLKKTC